MKKFFIFIASFTLVTFAEAASYYQTSVEVDRLGGQAGQVFYMNFKEGFKTDCIQGVIYCPASNDSCKYLYTLVLSAKMAGKKLLSVDYTQDDTSKYCVLTSAQIN